MGNPVWIALGLEHARGQLAAPPSGSSCASSASWWARYGATGAALLLLSGCLTPYEGAASPSPCQSGLVYDDGSGECATACAASSEACPPGFGCDTEGGVCRPSVQCLPHVDDFACFEMCEGSVCPESSRCSMGTRLCFPVPDLCLGVNCPDRLQCLPETGTCEEVL